MFLGQGRFALWVPLSCTVPLAALAAVLVFNAPVLPASLVALAVLGLIAPRLFAASGTARRAQAGAGKPEPGNR